ncbi:MAG: hypothetical protein QOH96_3674 [Blastocatellia bacterium]|nr:hypothetical protein [Blastocatellia bacterium]
MSSAPFRSQHCPSCGPTRLADGLGLEVSYVNTRIHVSPLVSLARNIGSPASSVQGLMTSADKISTSVMLLPGSFRRKHLQAFGCRTSAADMNNRTPRRILLGLT